MNSNLFILICLTISKDQLYSIEITCKFNVGFCVDSSNSLSDEAFNKEINFVKDYYRKLSMKTEFFIPAALVSFSSAHMIYTQFKYTDYNEKYKVINAIKVNHSRGNTFIGLCMRQLAAISTGNDYPKIMLVVTDGHTSVNDPLDEVIKEKNVSEYIKFAVGFGLAKHSTLLKIANQNENNTFLKENVDQLLSITEDLTKDICEKVIPCINPPNIPYANRKKLYEQCSNKQVGFSCPVDCANGTLNGENPICEESGNYSTPLPTCVCHPETYLIEGIGCGVCDSDEEYLENERTCVLPYQSPHRAKESGRTFKWWIWILIGLAALALLLGLGFLAFKLLSKNKPPGPSGGGEEFPGPEGFTEAEADVIEPEILIEG